MGVFSSIKDKLFGKPATGAAAAQPAGTAPLGQAALSAKAASLLGAAVAPKPEPVDIEAVIEAAVKAKGQPSNWRVSIVDLLKALDLDSSLAARKELAAELNYTGTDPDGSAEKNTWLHQALMKALAENGGKVPTDLLK